MYRALLPILALSACTQEAAFPEVVALTDLDASSPVLERLADRFDVVGPASQSGAPTLALAMDLSLASPDVLQAHRSRIAAALDDGVPVILENAGDPEQVAGLVGIGAVGEALLFQPDASGGKLTVFDRHTPELSWEQDHTEAPIGATADWAALDDAGRAALLAEVGTTASEVEALLAAPVDHTRPDLPELAFRALQPFYDDVADDIGDALVAGSVAGSGRVTFVGTPPAGKRRSYWVDYQVHNLSIGNQTARLNLNHYVDLVAAGGMKYAVISGDNGDISPGGLSWNTEGSAFKNADIGYFQDRVEILDNVSTPTFMTHHMPASSGVSGYATNNGCTYTASSGAFSCGSPGGWQSVSEWELFDISGTNLAGWRWEMVETDAGDYDSPDDITDIWWGGLETPGGLATGGFAPDFEAVFAAGSSLNAVQTLSMTQKQHLVHVWTKTRWLWQNVYWETTWHSYTRNVSVDFGQVN
jgi:hypothetical protein